MDFYETYWNNRYISGEMGWDIGYPSTPLKEYFDQLVDKEQKILIPGAGNAYEAEYLHRQGFKNVHVLDISCMALRKFQERVPDFPENHLVHADFFNHEASYDRIIEQTFFCALPKKFRTRYVEKMKSLLKPDGKLVGLLFNIPLNDDKPPFGGNEKEYRALFEPHFNIEIMETAYNSIPERQGNELFVKMSTAS
ncbi:TPMT family class I SAM-dependent methyltransferase [Flavobacteriaceae bacterium TK19130]|nr:TPMT family class I SAM-dependent methyltransferase [Thermobacterium salinum]